jgi:phenylalanyl-tRNA synthetase beta chain
MQFSLNFIKEFLEINVSPQRIASLLTMVGMEVEHLEKKGSDWIFQIEVTSNRYDWLSMVGIAREIAALLNKKLKLSYSKIKKAPLIKGRDIRILDIRGCPFYSGRVLRGVKVKESPPWLKERLLHCGINSVNNIVDITNYCMLKWGNPLHAFDEDKIEGNIYIRRAKQGENFLGIDNKERILNRENLVIVDNKKVIALAGVIGAKNTEVDSNTKNVFLEGAIFSPLTIRRSRRSVGLETESSYRFERKVSLSCLRQASYEASNLMEKLSGGFFHGYKEKGRHKERKKRIQFDLKELNQYLGTAIPYFKTKNILNTLGFKTKRCQNKILVFPPIFRFDVEQEVDIYEEVARFYGYENIAPQIPSLKQPLNGGNESFAFKNSLRNYLSLLGLKEIITYSIDAQKEMDTLEGRNVIRILNPLRKQENVLRPHLLLGMIKTIRYNLNHNQNNLCFFEIADVYLKLKSGYIEKPFLAIGVSGESSRLFFLKAVIKELLSFLNLENFIFEEVSFNNFFNALEIAVGNTNLGFLGKLNEKTGKEFGLKENLFFAQLDLTVLEKIKKSKVYIPFSPYPFIWRDISIGLSREKKFIEVENIVREKAGSYLGGLEVVDIYKAKDIPKNYYVFTLRLFYQSKERTLTSEEIDSLHSRIRELLAEREGIILR